MATKRTRRPSEEVDKLAREAMVLIGGGKGADSAADEVGLSRSVFQRWRKKYKDGAVSFAGRSSGSMRVDALPPRPAKGGKRTPRPLNLNDVESIAKRIGKIDRQLKKLDPLSRERKQLADRLLDLLKGAK